MNLHRPIGVDDVAAGLTITRGSLEKRFRSLVGFDDHAWFTVVFKKTIGSTPLRYRRHRSVLG